MASKRQLQAAELVKRNFGEVLRQEGRYIYDPSILVTVTSVSVTPDLGLAKIYLSVYNTENKPAVLLLLQEQTVRLRKILSQRIRKHIRRIPNISIYLDDTLDEMGNLNAIFDKLAAERVGKSQEE